MPNKLPTLYRETPTGEVAEIELPFRWRICGHCEGHGRSSAYLGAFTTDDLDQAGPDFVDDYMAGRLDRPCEHCDGGRVRVPDFARMTPADRKAWREQCAADREVDAIEAAERAFGA